jgi:molecular chaperone GrpE
VTGPTCVEVYRPGYRHAGKVLRPAQVVVADAPEGEAQAAQPGPEQTFGSSTTGE